MWAGSNATANRLRHNEECVLYSKESHQGGLIGFFLGLLSIVVLKHNNQKQLEVEKIYFTLQLIIVKGSQNRNYRNMEVKTKAETMEEQCLLSCSPWLAQTAFFC